MRDNLDKNNLLSGDAELDRLISLSMIRSDVMAKVFFPEIFPAPFSPNLHLKVCTALDSLAKKVNIAAPRGFGKTSIVLYGYLARKILFRETRFVVFISYSSTHAELQTESLKRELLANTMVRKVFGSIRVGDIDTKELTGLDDEFSRSAWVAFGNTLVLPRGYGQQVRGILWRSRRPDLIIFDDLEDRKLLRSKEQREQIRTWFFSEPTKCISRYEKDYRMVYIDTLKHEDSLLRRNMDSEDWMSVTLEACDDNLQPTAPEYMDAEEIKKEYEAHKSAGQLDTFFREYRNLPMSTEGQPFPPESFNYFAEEGSHLRPFYLSPRAKETLAVRKRQDVSERREVNLTGIEPSNPAPVIPVSELFTMVLLDPAKTTKETADDSAAVCVSVHTKAHKIFVRDVIAGKFKPDEFLRRAFFSATQFKANLVAYETTSLHEYIKGPIEALARRFNMNVRLLEVHARGNKEDRILQLSPLYHQGYFYHNPNNSAKLESQLMTFPNGALVDVIDALSQVIYVMDSSGINFEPVSDVFMDDEDDFAMLKNESYPEQHYLI
jgi:predicted phage terminase large subunit-like protein